MKRAIAILALASCNDALDQRLAFIDEPRVLAVVAEPAEARAGDTVTYTATIAAPEGSAALVPAWAYCTTPRAPTEDNAVSAGCVAGRDLLDLGTGASVTGVIPGDACARFGPDVPAGEFRPRDPDPTGGYFQPVRVDTEGAAALAFGLSRITCNLAGASPEVSFRYLSEYVANENPIIDPLEGDLARGRAPANREVTLRASWPASSAEDYLWFDADRQDLVVRREAIRVSWYVTGGQLPVDASLVAEDDLATSAETVWRTPGPGAYTVWIVVRDGRGGAAIHEARVTVD